MGNCFSISDINRNGTINVDITNNLTQNNSKNKPTNQNNDECSILISSSSMELNYNVKYRESSTLQMYEKSQNNKK